MKCKNIECKSETRDKNIYCSLKCRNIYVNKYIRNYTKNGIGISKAKIKISVDDYLKNPKTCKECNLPIPYEKRRNVYCNRSCSAKHANKYKIPLTKNQKDKISNSIKQLWINGHYDNMLANSLNNEDKFNLKFNSKNEREICKYFKSKYIDDDWKSGGLLKYRGKRISRDLYSSKLKVCFEYDGIWHFEDIHGQLSDKNEKDNLLEDWCIKNNYRLVRIDENDYININQIVDLIYNRKETVIKIGSRYKRN